MLQTTLGQLLVNEELPEDLRDYQRKLDSKQVKALFQQIALRYPDRYKHIAKRLSNIGREIAHQTGGFSFGIEALRTSEPYAKLRQQLVKKLDALLDSPLDEEKKKDQMIKLLVDAQKKTEQEVIPHEINRGNPLGLQILSGSRGKPKNLLSLTAADFLYLDNHNRPVLVPILRSLSESYTPAEYFAAAFGTRKGIADTKISVRDSGYFSKQLVQAAHRLLVTALDAEDEKSLAQRGMPVATDDPDNAGALLAFPVGGYPRNTVLTPKILKHLQAKGISRIVVRSPIVGGSPDGGIYARDVGIRERGTLAPLGEQAGLAAAQALSEPISQAGLNSKHTAGIVGTGATLTGFKALNQLVQVPKTFAGGAAHAQLDGKVTEIRPLESGGQAVIIDGQEHYVPQGVGLKVKVGDVVEAGDVLSEGLPNPAQVVRHKGIGEGRRYFVDVFRKMMQDSGITAHRRNIELVARGLINHVKLTEPVGEFLPGDVVPYHLVEANWEPRQGTKKVKLSQAVNKYLERPVLHYSVGTRLTPKMLKELEEFKIKELEVHDEPPDFEPVMIRGLDNLQHDPDWMTRMLGSNLKKSLLKGVWTGAVSDEEGTSFVPGLAKGVEFGKKGPVRTPVFWEDL